MKPTLHKFTLYIFLFVSLISFQANTEIEQKTKAKFEPDTNKCLFFISQDMSATGALDNYNNGYCDFFDVPSGFTIYTNLSPGSEPYGYNNKGLDGLKTKANWGSGDSCGQCYLDDTDYNNSVLAIGLSIVNNEKKIATGQRDELIKELGEWIKSTKRPVFLRIGYEFDGWEWNHYKKKHYLKAWRRIHNIFETMTIDNVAFVWQSKGHGSNQDTLEDWYPGDAIVDWCAYSYFGNPDEEMLTFARRHNKPVFIAEATPIMETDGLFFNSKLSDPKNVKRIWNKWFVSFFKTINDNKDVIKAFSYINTNWSSQPMWLNNPVFQKVDSRIQMSDYVSEKWTKEISKPRYLKANSELWNSLSKY